MLRIVLTAVLLLGCVDQGWSQGLASTQSTTVTLLELLRALQNTTGCIVLYPSRPTMESSFGAPRTIEILGEPDLSRADVVRALLLIQGYEIEHKLLVDGSRVISVTQPNPTFGRAVLVVPDTTDLDAARERAVRVLLEHSSSFRVLPSLRLSCDGGCVFVLGPPQVLLALAGAGQHSGRLPRLSSGLMWIGLAGLVAAGCLQRRRRVWAAVVLLGIGVVLAHDGGRVLSTLQQCYYGDWEYYAVHEEMSEVTLQREPSVRTANAARGTKEIEFLPGPEVLVRRLR